MTISTETLVHDVALGIKALGGIASVEEKVMPAAMFVAGFFPGAASVLAAIAVAQPYIDKFSAAAPAIAAAVEAGEPVIDAIRKSGPNVMGHIKTAISIMSSGDPTKPTLAPHQVTDQMVADGMSVFARSFFSPQDPRFDRLDSADSA